MSMTSIQLQEPVLDSSTSNGDQVHVIRQWINENCFDSSRQDERFILRFLRGSQFDIEDTKKRIIGYYDLRKTYPKWFERSPESEEIVEYFYKNNVGYVVIPGKANGQTVGVIKLGAIDLKKFNVECALTWVNWAFETHAEDPRFNSMEVHCILDFKDIGLTFMSKMSLRFIWKVLDWQVAMPLDINFHILNAPAFMYTSFSLYKMFVKQLYLNKLVFHDSGFKSIFEYIRPENLPLEYGGTAGPEQIFCDLKAMLVVFCSEIALDPSRSSDDILTDAGIELLKKEKQEMEFAEKNGQGDGKVVKRKKNKRKKKKRSSK